MKKYGTLIAFGVAVLFGIVAVMLANNWLETKTSEKLVVKKEAIPMTKVVISNQPLSIGTKLSKDNMALADWPKANKPVGAFEDMAELEGRIVVAKTVAGAPILSAALAAPGSGVGLVAVIKSGKRAMAIRVDEVIGVGGFILPNTFVDVISVKNLDTSGKKKKAKTVLERIEVLAIAQETFTEEGKAKIVRTVTLELEPKQAEKLALETNEGEIHLVLRNPLDEEEEKVEPPKPQPTIAKATRYIPTLKARVRVPAPSSHAVEVIRGSRPVEKVEFEHVDSEQRI